MTNAPAPNPAERSTRTMLRWLRPVAVAMLLAAVAYWLLTDSFVTRWVVTRELRKAFESAAGPSGRVTLGSVRVEPGGKITISDLQVRASDSAGRAAELLSIPKVIASVELKGLLRGKPKVLGIRLQEPSVVLSRHGSSGRVNIAGLAQALASGTAAPTISGKDIPTIVVERGTIELGEHDDTGSYDALNQLTFSGQVQRAQDEQGEAVINFRQVSPDDAAPFLTPSDGLAVEGSFGPKALTLAMSGVDFSSITPDQTPSQMRDFFERMKLEGKAPRTVVTFEYAGDWKVAFKLREVALNLPVEARPDEDDLGNAIASGETAGRLMRLQRTNGEVEVSGKGVLGSLDGFLEELPYTVSFRTEGLSAQSPWTCTLLTRGFRLEQRPEILKFAPALVRTRLRDFSNPEGVLDAQVTISGAGAPEFLANFVGPPAPPLPPSVQGQLVLRDVTAAFYRFPYEFQRLRGRVTFDDDSIKIDRISGVAPGGATLVATGTISPITDDAGVDLDVAVEKLPIDAKLLTAMKERGKAITELFNADRAREMIDRGLIISSRRRDELLTAIARLKAEGKESSPEAALLEAEASRPAFEPGGIVDVAIKVFRKPGPENRWDDSITITMRDVGLLPRSVPYPFRVRGTTVTLKDDIATVSGGLYEGLQGGTAVVAARADIRQLSREETFTPEVEVALQGLPIDAILLNALPATPVGEAGLPLGRTLAFYNPEGNVSGTITLRNDEKGAGRTSAQIDFKDVRLRVPPRDPQLDEPGVEVAGLEGSIDTEEGAFAATLRGAAGNTASNQTGTIHLTATGRAPADLRAMRDGGAPWSLRLEAGGERMPVALAVERLIDPWSRTTADRIRQLRSTFRPLGVIDADVRLEASKQGAASGSVVLSRWTGAGVDWAGKSIDVGDVSGKATVLIADGTAQAVDLEGVSCTPALGGKTAGRIAASGTVELGTQPGAARQELSVTLGEARAEHELWKSVLKTYAPKVHAMIEKFALAGTFDATLGVVPPTAEQVREAIAAGRPVKGATRGELYPRDLSLTADGVRVEFPRVAGSIEIAGKSAGFDDLRLEADGFVLLLQGSTMARADGGTDIDLVLGADGNGLLPAMRALLPAPVRAGLKSLNLDFRGPVRARGVALSFSTDDQGRIAAANTRGSVDFQNASGDVGVRITEADGTLGFSYQRKPGQQTDAVSVEPSITAARAMGVRVTDLTASVVGGERGAFLVPDFSGNVHGGRITGSLSLGQPASVNARRPYELNVEASGLRFASVLEDIKAKPMGAGDAAALTPTTTPTITPTITGALAEAEPASTQPAENPDESRGLLSGNLTMSGLSGDVASRRGRGSATVRGGEILELPALVPLLRVTNLQIPVREKIDYGLGDFFVDGPVFAFEQLSVSSRSVGLYGYGTVTMPDLALDLRFKTGNRTRIPILTNIVEELRQELVSTVVRGTVNAPDVRTASFSGTRDVLDDIFGDGKSTDERRLDMIERQVSPRQRRQRPEDEEPIKPLPPQTPSITPGTGTDNP